MKILRYLGSKRKAIRRWFGLIIGIISVFSLVAMFTGGVHVYAGAQPAQPAEQQAQEQQPANAPANVNNQENPAVNGNANAPQPAEAAPKWRERQDAGHLRDVSASMTKAVSYITTAIADTIRSARSGNFQAFPLVIATLKSTVNVLTAFSKYWPGLGNVVDSLIDGLINIIEASTDGSRQSDTARLMSFISDQINLVREDIIKVRQDIVELSNAVNEGFETILNALKDSFENFEAKTRVNEFFSTSTGAFSYKQLKRYLYSDTTDGYAHEFTGQLFKENPNEELVTTLSNKLYFALMSTTQDRTSYLEMFYDNIMQTESHRSIFEYYADFLNSNSGYLNGQSPALASVEFMNDVYATFLTSINYVRTINTQQRTEMLLKIEDINNVNFDELKYKYGSGENDYITYNDLAKIEKRLNEMVENVDYQVSKDMAYVLKLDKNYFYTAKDGVFRSSYKTKAETFGNVEVGYKLQFTEINQSVAQLLGYDINNFKYYLTDSDGNKLNEGQEDKKTYTVNTTKPFNLVVKYEVKDKYGDPVYAKNEYGVEEPLVYTIYNMSFRVGVKNSFIAGSGTQQDPYIIGNADQFKLIGTLDRHNCYSLITDVDLSNETITQFFDDITPYAGSFNGNDHLISNFKLSTAKKQPSLFGYISSTGSVNGLKIWKASIQKSDDNDSTKLVGGIIAGVNNGTISFINIDSCDINISRDSKETNNNVNKAIQIYVGGVVAENYGSVKYIAVKWTNVKGYSKRYYGSNEDGANANDVYAGGVVGYNGADAELSYAQIDGNSRIDAGIVCESGKSFSTRRPYGKAYAGGIAGSAADTKNINNLYVKVINLSATAEVENYGFMAFDTDKNISKLTSQYVAGQSSNNIYRIKEEIEWPPSKTYTATLKFSGEMDTTYNIDKSLVLEPGTKAFYPAGIQLRLKDDQTGVVKSYSPAIVAVRGFDSKNASLTESVSRKVQVDVSVQETGLVYTFNIDYVILPDSPKRIDVRGAGTTEFAYTTDESAKIVDQKANQVLGTDKIYLVTTTGRELKVNDEATISIDVTKLGKQKAILKAKGFTYAEFEVNVVCASHSWINEQRVVEGYEVFTDSVTGEPYFRLYGYTTKECEHCHLVVKELFADIYSTEIINRVEATCAAVGYTGDRVPYYLNELNEKVYLDYVLEKGTTIPTIPHTYLHEDNMAGRTHTDYGHECGICGHIEPHLYSLVETSSEVLNGLVYTCETCGHTIVVENVSKEYISKLPRVVVNDSYALPGVHQVVVYVDLHANVGITSANFSIIYDSNLTLVSYRLGNILNDSKISSFKEYEDHLNVVLAQTSSDVSTDGTILKLVFETPANASAEDRYKIDVVNKGNTDRFTDKNGNKLEFLSYEGYINIVEHLPGDVNGDGAIDMLDVLIVSKYIVLDDFERANYISEMTSLNPSFSISYGDVNLDNIIDTDDVVRLLRFDVGGYESQIISQKFIVNLNYNDGTGTVVPYLVDYNFGNGTYGNLPTPQKSGYRFDGWYTDITGGDKITSTSYVKYNNEQYAQTLYAHFTINMITFDSNGGMGEKPAITMYTDSKDMNFSIYSPNGDQYIIKESTVTFDTNLENAVNKTDTYRHVFLGWSTSADGKVITNLNSLYDLTNFKDSQVGSVTLYAIWKDVEIEYYTPSEASVTGYSVAGWMTKKNGTLADVVWKETDGNYKVSENVTFYAKWDLVRYYIIYDANGGKTSDNQVLYFEGSQRNSKVEQPLTSMASIGFNKTGYTFAGWTTDVAFAESWFYLVEKNYNEIISGFNYKYVDGMTRPITNTDYAFVDGALLQASISSKPDAIRNSSNYITKGVVEDLEQFIDENGFVTLYALWTPNKISITYNTESTTAVLNGTGLNAKNNPVTLPYYYGYDIILPFDLYVTHFDGKSVFVEETVLDNRISKFSIPLLTDKELTRSNGGVLYSYNLPTTPITADANVEFETDNKEVRYVHYLYKGYELFTDKRYDGYYDDGSYTFATDLSAIGLSKDYYYISSYKSIVDSKGTPWISENTKYTDAITPGTKKTGALYNVLPDLYIEVELVGGTKLIQGNTSPIGRASYQTYVIKDNGDFTPIRNTKNVFIVPDKMQVSSNEIEDVRNLVSVIYELTGNYYDNAHPENNFKVMLLPSGLQILHKNAIDKFLDYVEILVLPDAAGITGINITSNTGSLKRIVLSKLDSFEDSSLIYNASPNYIVDIYYRGTAMDLAMLEAKSPQAAIFDKTLYKIRCYSELDDDSNKYWQIVNGNVLPCIVKA